MAVGLGDVTGEDEDCDNDDEYNNDDDSFDCICFFDFMRIRRWKCLASGYCSYRMLGSWEQYSQMSPPLREDIRN